jgi:parvulin-like peptidyl-prolyl isomerase
MVREPLVHFLLLGAILFALYSWRHPGHSATDEILVTSAQQAALKAQYTKLWQRPPTAQEFRTIIDGWVREEALYREGHAMGLDREDELIRRRTAQKVEFLAEEANPAPPTDADLQAWLQAHQSRYLTEPRYSFRQVYFDPSRHSSDLDAALDGAQRKLAGGTAVTGDSTLLPSTLTNVSGSEIERTFGSQFAASLATLALKQWSSPVKSGLGMHLVYVTQREPGRNATLAEARAEVARDLEHDRAEKDREAFYRRILQNYTVRIEGETPAAHGGTDR